jgi:archaellin
MLLPDNTIVLVKGSSKRLQLTVTEQDGKTPVDLTGCKVLMTVKRDASDPTALLQKSSDQISQIEITSPTHGLAQIKFVPTDSRGIDTRQYSFDVWVVLPNGDRFQVVGTSVLDVQGSVTGF